MQPTVCKNCGAALHGQYCSQCGQKAASEHDKSILHLLEENVHFLTHFEGSFFTTLKTIFSKPGQLSLDYCNGIRKRYFKPVSFFLLLVVLYLLFPLFQGLNMPLNGHLDGQPYSASARHMAKPKFEQYLRQTGDSALARRSFSEAFAKKSGTASKVLLFVIIPLCALPLYFVFRKRRRWLFDHLILSTEINSFYIILVFFILAGVLSLAGLFAKRYWQTHTVWIDFFMSITAYLIIARFCKIAFGRMYGLQGWRAALAVLVFLAWHYVVVYFIYKFLLFATVMALL